VINRASHKGLVHYWGCAYLTLGEDTCVTCRQKDCFVSFRYDVFSYRTKALCLQLGFFNIVGIPLFKTMVELFEDAQPILDGVLTNFRHWEAGTADV
jgi:hypothetical protein